MTHPSSLRAESDLFERDSVTFACYWMLAMLTLGSGMLGPLVPWLRDSLQLDYEQAAYHSAAMATGVAATALLMPQIAPLLGRLGCVAVALIAISAGIIVVCAAETLSVSLLGCLVIGAATPMMITVAPAVLAERHGANTRIAMAEANAIAYVGFVLAPAIVAAAAAAGAWRLSFLPVVMLAVAFWTIVRKLPLGSMQMTNADNGEQTLPPAYWFYWVLLLLSICAELALIIFVPSYLEAELKLPRDQAILASMVFPLGMALGRFCVALLLRRSETERLVLPAIALATAGSLVIVWSQDVAAACFGLIMAAFGIAGLYPFGITLMMQAAGVATSRAAARASIASGLATLAGPLAMGLLADRHGLGAAFSIVPAFLALAAVAYLLGRRAAH